MGKIRTAVFTAPMGHDVVRVTGQISAWLEDTGLFEVSHAGWFRGAPRSVAEFMEDRDAVGQTDLFILNCPDDPFTTAESRRSIERAVAAGAGLLAFHGIQPSCHGWTEMEKMIGLLWRDTASHGDYDWFDVNPTAPEHPRQLLPSRRRERWERSCSAGPRRCGQQSAPGLPGYWR